MTQDVEMKELPAPSNSVTSNVPSTLQHLKEITSLIETGVYAKEVCQIMRAVRLTLALRKKLKTSVLSAFLNYALPPSSEALTKLMSYLPQLWLRRGRVMVAPRLKNYCFMDPTFYED